MDAQGLTRAALPAVVIGVPYLFKRRGRLRLVIDPADSGGSVSLVSRTALRVRVSPTSNATAPLRVCGTDYRTVAVGGECASQRTCFCGASVRALCGRGGRASGGVREEAHSPPTRSLDVRRERRPKAPHTAPAATSLPVFFKAVLKPVRTVLRTRETQEPVAQFRIALLQGVGARHIW